MTDLNLIQDDELDIDHLSIVSISSLVTLWITNLRDAQTGHYQETERLNILNQKLGVLLIIITTFVTAFIFYTPPFFTELFKIFLGLCSASAAALSGIVSFGRFSDRATEHRITASRYGKLRRQLEFLQGVKRHQLDFSDFNQKLKLLRIEWEYVASSAPLTPKKKKKKATGLSFFRLIRYYILIKVKNFQRNSK